MILTLAGANWDCIATKRLHTDISFHMTANVSSSSRTQTDTIENRQLE